MENIFLKFLDDEYQSIEYGSKSYKILNSLIHFDEVEPMVNKIFKNE